MKKQDWEKRFDKAYPSFEVCGEIVIDDEKLKSYIQSELDRQLLEILKILEWRPKYGDENEINAFVRQIQIKIINLNKK